MRALSQEEASQIGSTRYKFNTTPEVDTSQIDTGATQAPSSSSPFGQVQDSQTPPKGQSWWDKFSSGAKAFNKAGSDFVTGQLKGAASTALSVGELGSKALESGYNATIGKLTGTQAMQGASLAEEAKQSQYVKPEGLAQNLGFGTEHLGEFLIPTGLAGKTAKTIEGAKMLSKAPRVVKGLLQTGAKVGVEGLEQSARSALQKGNAGSAVEDFKMGAEIPLGFAALGAAGKVGGKVAKFMASKMSGVPLEAIEHAISNPQAVRNVITGMAKDASIGPQQVVAKAEDALQALKATRREAYKQSLSVIESNKQPIVQDINKVKEAAKKAFGDFNINISAADELQSTVKTVLPKGHVSDLAEVYDRVKNWDDFTPSGIDDLREVVSSFERGGINPPKADKQFNKVLGDIKRNIVELLPKDVKEMNKQYAVQSEFIDRVMQELSLGKDKPVTAARKLMNMFNPKNNVYRDVVKELGEQTAKDIQSDVAGMLMSRWTPEGLGAYITSGLGGAGAVHALTNPASIPLMGLGLAAGSPRIVGQAATAFGKAAQSGTLSEAAKLAERATLGAAAQITKQKPKP